MELFGFEIKRKIRAVEPEGKTFSPPINDEGSIVLSGDMPPFGTTASIYSYDVNFRNEKELINRYRMVAMQPEAELAIDDIIDEAIVVDNIKPIVTLNTDELNVSDNIKKKIHEEFEHIYKLLDFSNRGHDIFKRWYIDGRLYYHMITEDKNPTSIIEMRPIDPRNIKKVKKITKEKDSNGNEYVKKIDEFFIYSEHTNIGTSGSMITSMNQAMSEKVINPDVICHVPSGLIDNGTNMSVGMLQKALKPFNQLRMMEDSIIIYTVSRAPTRRIFYIDVGNLPKIKAEEYMKSLMNMYRNRIVYDATTGEIADDRRHMHMLEDFWLPRRNGSASTEISNLPGQTNLGDIEEYLLYFQRKFYRALGVPISRLEPGSGFNLGKSSEITRDEIKFSKFVDRLRSKFTKLFNDSLKFQLILKKVIKPEEWKDIYDLLKYEWNKDSFFSELKSLEILNEKMVALQQASLYTGIYFSQNWIKKNILFQSDEEIEKVEKEMETEPPIQPPAVLEIPSEKPKGPPK